MSLGLNRKLVKSGQKLAAHLLENRRSAGKLGSSDYYNRRVFTETGQTQADDFEMDKQVGKLALQFAKHKTSLKPSTVTRKPERKLLSGSKEKNPLYSMALDGQKTNVMISTNNIHQNISIFAEDRPHSRKVLVTEGSAKQRSKDKLIKKDSKKALDKLAFRKDKKSTGGREIRLNKSKDWKEFREPTNHQKERHLKTQAAEEDDEPQQSIPEIEMLEKVGQGTFGEVYKARLLSNGKIVAVKRVFQDRKYKNRQLEILKQLNHDFVLRVLFTFLTRERAGKNQEEMEYLNVVMEYFEHNLYQVSCGDGYPSKRHLLPDIQVKLYMYQLFRGLTYIHSLDICHRDIKPPNILVNKKTHKLVICDFGSAKKLIKGEPNISYICSRCYRAPQLIFGSVNYTTMIDVWSAGCVLLELLKGQPFFIGDSNVDQLVEIIKVLGTPSKTEVVNMNPQYDLDDYKFPKIKAKQWTNIFPKADDKLISLIKELMIYSPKQRLNAVEALAHDYFDQIREEVRYKELQAKKNIPSLFDFTKQQLRGNEHLIPKLVPSWHKAKRHTQHSGH